MKKIIDWMKIWFGILLMMILWIFVIKATWTSTNPWTNDADLFVDSSGTLTKDKWNSLVNKVNSISTTNATWQIVDLNDATTKFDKNCFRRWEWVTNATACTSSNWTARYTDMIDSDSAWIRYNEVSYNYLISYTNKKQMCQSWTTCSWKICKLEKLCN